MNKHLFVCGLCILGLGTSPTLAKEPVTADPEFDEILSQDISDLNVTSVAKRSQRLTDTAAATYVITQEELRRAGIYSIPEALRLVPGVQVAKVPGDRWAISTRGFNGVNSNKLLVLIDGRAIYTPVFSGVYWGDQGTSINDIERIEVVRGPGASLYGANAVNGVINIITKSAENTQGNMVSATATAKANGVYEARHGGQLSTDDYYRVYGQYYDGINWVRGRSGFRIDGKNSSDDTFTLQGDAYGGRQDARINVPIYTSPYSASISSRDDAYGGNILGRWSHDVSADSEISVQAYIDHYSRLEANFEQNVSTADIQFQNSRRLNDRNHFVWGTGARLYYQNLSDTYSAQVNDQYDTHQILSAFAQNEYAAIPNELYLTLGSKFEYNDFTGFELQPNARLAWHPTENQTIWGAISRAVRTPSSVEQDVSILTAVTPTTPFTEARIIGNPDQESEELIAYELGHRIQPSRNLSFDTTVFFNDFDNLLTLGAPGTPFTGDNGSTVIPYMLNNLGSGHAYGAEIAATWNVNNNWRLSGSYSYLRLNLGVDPGTTGNLDMEEDNAPKHQFAIQSYYNITPSVQWDNMLYYVDDIAPPVDAYFRYDTRLAWLVQPGLEVSFIGRNLAGKHREFPSSRQTEIDRSYIGQVLWKF